MAITIFQIIPELLKTCPELQPGWDGYSERMKDRGSATAFFSGPSLYLRIRNARTEGEMEFFPRFFEFLEHLITNGNAEVKGIAVDGFLKGLHKANLIAIKPGPDAFALWMRPETTKHWRRFSEARAANDKLKDVEEENLRRRSMFFRLRPAKLWGDYGTVLMNGFGRRDAASGQLLLDRAGPFSPPISFPHESKTGRCAVVTQSFRELLEGAGLGELTFTPVIKNRVVDLPWHTWDRLTVYPGVTPEGGEPENLIEAREHSETATREMEELWELTPPGVHCEVNREEPENPGFRELARFSIRPGVVIYQSLFSPSDNSHFWLVDEPTRLWFEQHAGEWVQFDYVICGD